jgi:hypothetical protein
VPYKAGPLSVATSTPGSLGAFRERAVSVGGPASAALSGDRGAGMHTMDRFEFLSRLISGGPPSSGRSASGGRRTPWAVKKAARLKHLPTPSTP